MPGTASERDSALVAIAPPRMLLALSSFYLALLFACCGISQAYSTEGRLHAGGRLAGLGRHGRAESDLARYLRFDPSTIARAATVRKRKAATGKTVRPAGGGASALAPLAGFIDANSGNLEKSGFDVASLRETVVKLAEGLLRAGFGVPRRFHGLVAKGCRPVETRLDRLMSAIRKERNKAGVVKIHLELEAILAKAQETHYLLSRLHEALFQAEGALASREPALGEMSAAGGLVGRLGLCLMQVCRISRTDMRAALEALDQDRRDLKRAFAILSDTMELLDDGIEKSWAIPVEALRLGDLPGYLRKVYRLLGKARTRVAAMAKRAPALDALIKTNFRSAAASVAALTGTSPGYGSSQEEADRLTELCRAGLDHLKGILRRLDEEADKLAAWAGAIRKLDPQEPDIPFPPECVLLDDHRGSNEGKREVRAEAAQEAILFDPAIDTAFSTPGEGGSSTGTTGGCATAAPAHAEAPGSHGDGRSGGKTHAAGGKGDIVRSIPSSGSGRNDLNGEEIVALERDMKVLDELEDFMRGDAEAIADGTTSAFVDSAGSGL